jgi:putative hemolysin
VIDQTIGIISFTAALLFDVMLAAARSAFVNSRLSQLKTLEETYGRRAALAVQVLAEARRLILALRIGQTLIRLLVLGLALTTFTPMLTPIGITISGAIAIILAAAGLVLGMLEFSFENIVLKDPEAWALRFAIPVAVLVRVFEPIGWLLLRLARLIAAPSGSQPHPIVTEEEIMTLVDAGQEEGVIEQEEKAMIYSIFQLDNTLAREVMVPRIDIIAFEEHTTLQEATETLLKTGHSRAPVFSETIDNVIGLVYIKDLLAAWSEQGLDQKLSEIMREAYFVPEAKKVDDLLTEMQATRMHIAIVVDEYGGTAGVVTIEDIVEEIVGEILDEYDFAEELPYEQLAGGEFIFSGGIDIDDVNQITGAQIPKDTSETLGGYIYGRLGKVPVPGETVEIGGLRLSVEQVVGRRIRKIRAKLVPVEPRESKPNDADNSTAQ